MEKYNKQSGVFKVDNYDNTLAFIGGDKEHKSTVLIGILDVDIDGVKEVGLHFAKAKESGEVNEKINNLNELIDSNSPSFVFVPHSIGTINSLIRYLNDLKTQF